MINNIPSVVSDFCFKKIASFLIPEYYTTFQIKMQAYRQRLHLIQNCTQMKNTTPYGRVFETVRIFEKSKINFEIVLTFTVYCIVSRIIFGLYIYNKLTHSLSLMR